MSIRDDATTGGRAVLGWILVVALVFATAGAGWYFFQKPDIDRGYAAQVGGLVTAYCTSSNQHDADVARGDIIAQRDAAPNRWARMGDAAKARAQQVIARDNRVCQ